MRVATLLFFFLPRLATAQEPLPALRFFAADPQHGEFADSARKLWQVDGSRVIAALQAASGLRFRDQEITVIMRGATASSGAAGNPNSPLRLDLRYPILMSLTHELGHRLNAQLTHLPPELKSGHGGLDAHKLLYLYLYEVWVQLYGTQTADTWRDTERGWADLGYEFIRTAWDWAMALGPEGRARKFREVVAANR